MGKDWVEDWLDPDDDLQEVEVEPDVFYDYFLSIPTLKCQRVFKQYKTQFLAKINEQDAHEIANDVGDPTLVGFFEQTKDTYNEWKKLNWAWTFEKEQAGEASEKATKLKELVRKQERKITERLREHFKGKV